MLGGIRTHESKATGLEIVPFRRFESQLLLISTFYLYMKKQSIMKKV